MVSPLLFKMSPAISTEFPFISIAFIPIFEYNLLSGYLLPERNQLDNQKHQERRMYAYILIVCLPVQHRYIVLSLLFRDVYLYFSIFISLLLPKFVFMCFSTNHIMYIIACIDAIVRPFECNNCRTLFTLLLISNFRIHKR